MSRKSWAKKLPEYQELKRLVVEEHWSYRKISIAFGVHHDSVYQKLKTGARNHGDEWPLVRSWRATFEQGVRDSTIDSAGLAILVDERLKKDVPPRELVGPVWVGTLAAQMHAPRTRVYYRRLNDRKPHLGSRISGHVSVWPKKVAYFHFAGCSSLVDKNIFTLDAEDAQDWGYLQCSVCSLNGSVRDWCKEHGLSQTYISKLLNGAAPRIRYTQAIKILKALNEPMPTFLKNYRTRIDSCDDHKRKAA